MCDGSVTIGIPISETRIAMCDVSAPHLVTKKGLLVAKGEVFAGGKSKARVFRNPQLRALAQSTRRGPPGPYAQPED
jgi:hypothetical protein